jgi:hypothetical protein
MDTKAGGEDAEHGERAEAPAAGAGSKEFDNLL